MTIKRLKNTLQFTKILMIGDITVIRDFLNHNEENLLGHMNMLLRKTEEPGDLHHQIFQSFIDNQKKYLINTDSAINREIIQLFRPSYTLDYKRYMQNKIGIDTVLIAGINPFFEKHHREVSIFTAAALYKRSDIYKKIIDDNVVEEKHIEKVRDVLLGTDDIELEKVIAYKLSVEERRALNKSLMTSELKSFMKI